MRRKLESARMLSQSQAECNKKSCMFCCKACPQVAPEETVPLTPPPRQMRTPGMKGLVTRGLVKEPL